MDYNTLDVVVGAVVLLAASGGYRAGLVARAAAWAGIGLGVVGATWVLPQVMARAEGDTSLFLPILGAGVLSLGASVGGGLGQVVGYRLRRLLPPGPLRSADRVGGGAMGALAVFIGLWLLLPILVEIPGGVAQQARRSVLARAVNALAPERPDAIESLRKFVGSGRVPQVFESLRPAPDTGPLPTTTPVPPEVLERVRRSTVKIESQGCGALHSGSGFAAATDLVVTNAHVVAGADRVRVLRPDGRRLTASVVAFDDNRDLALLRVPGLGQTPLPIARSAAGQQGAVLGHPGGQNAVRIAPAAVRDKGPAVGRDIYGDDVTRRLVLFLAARLAQGDSGAPMVNEGGQVIGVAFAIAPDRPNTAYALADEELRTVLSAPRNPGSGACIR